MIRPEVSSFHRQESSHSLSTGGFPHPRHLQLSAPVSSQMRVSVLRVEGVGMIWPNLSHHPRNNYRVYVLLIVVHAWLCHPSEFASGFCPDARVSGRWKSRCCFPALHTYSLGPRPLLTLCLSASQTWKEPSSPFRQRNIGHSQHSEPDGGAPL